MKKVIGFGLVMLLAVPAMAQFMGLPVAGGAGLRPAGAFQASGGLVLGDDFNMYGVRGEMAVRENLSFFADVGMLDPDAGDTGWAIQGGGLYRLPLSDFPVDVGIRGVLGYGAYGSSGCDVTMLDLMAGVLVSKTIDRLTPYAFVGFNYWKWELDVTDGGSDDGNETDPAIAGGVEFAVTEQVSVYGELAHIDDLFFGLGARFRF